VSQRNKIQPFEEQERQRKQFLADRVSRAWRHQRVSQKRLSTMLSRPDPYQKIRDARIKNSLKK